MFSYEGKHYPPANGTKPAPRREHARSIGSPPRVAHEATRAENKRSGCGGQSTRLPMSLAARATPVRYSISISNIPALALAAFIGQSAHHAFFDDMDEFWLRNETDRPIRKDEAHLTSLHQGFGIELGCVVLRQFNLLNRTVRGRFFQVVTRLGTPGRSGNGARSPARLARPWRRGRARLLYSGQPLRPHLHRTSNGAGQPRSKRPSAQRGHR